jgi:DNA-directed RNA polymerase subunit beta
MLTIKSDDVVGRARAFEAIVKGTPIPAPTVPESFKVLMRELNSLGLDIIMQEAVEEEFDDDIRRRLDDYSGEASQLQQQAQPVQAGDDAVAGSGISVTTADDAAASAASDDDDDDDDDSEEPDLEKEMPNDEDLLETEIQEGEQE